jgi:hypothetical protein
MDIMKLPHMISNAATNLPITVLGKRSPYPTVVMDIIDSHAASSKFERSPG